MSVKYQHKVKTGDTLTSISAKYGVSIQSIKDANSGIEWEGEKRGGGHYIYAGEELTLPKNEKQSDIGNEILQEGNNTTGGNIAANDRDMFYLLAVSGTVWDSYNTFGYNHTSYPTTKGLMKPFDDFSGRTMSKQASKYFRRSLRVKNVGNFFTGVMVAHSTYNIYEGDRSFLNFCDGIVGSLGLTNSALLKWTSTFGSKAISRSIPIYGYGRSLYDASVVEQQNIRNNILNDRNPIDNIYTPSLGF